MPHAKIKAKIMEVFFDIEKYNDPVLDSRLLDIIFKFRDETLSCFEVFDYEINNQKDVQLIIIYKPTYQGVLIRSTNSELVSKMQAHFTKQDFRPELKKLLSSSKN